ncbi:UDP-N-acetylmuramoyl-L-alanine--D-glutamate ligase [Acidovorax sp. GW101-3H11]|uniref:UDP-N-acetylmuramoyl-L-alanine--D-glutamate ligase n=1 Tax=Acidovorax sp. GW101-3H11 TaxID=1813946 RepID=UPI000A46E489|nr:UDP-N-acetylmuramoyl-L-alanine--D-glutamate ligase [Acidovorax sp. GW101-3H11]
MNPNDPSTIPGTSDVPEATPTEAGLGVGAPGAASAGPMPDGVALPGSSAVPATPASEADVDAGVDTDLGPPAETAPELTAAPDAEAPAPATEAPATAPAPSTAWNPEAVPAVSAAKAAADFVAQIFAEVAAPEGPAAAEPDAAQDADVGEDAAPAEPLVSPVEAMAQLLQGQNILILGLGASGMAMARWCVRCGAQVTVADTRAAPPQLPALQQEMPQVRFVAGAFDASLVVGHNLQAVYRSPGLSPQQVAPVLRAAEANGVRAGGELSLYSDALAALRASHAYAPAVLAITGTNGKTTVTSLTGQLVERAGKSVAVAGNIGPTLLDTLATHLDADTLPEVWVLELSSFQLDGTNVGEGGFEPTAATVLNITQDHLDWHGGMDAYAAAKARIFGQAGLMILNREDPAVMAMLPPPVKVKLQKPQVRAHITFGADMPRRPGDFGIEVVSGMPWLVRAMDADETRKRGRNEVEEELHIQRLMPADALRIRGRHNATNALAALALASATGCPLAPMLYGLREYRGEPHRVEPVAILHGVEYFDDSKGTNVGATAAALVGLGAERRLVVILGGEGKGQDFAPLAAPVARYARAVVLIGRDAPLIRTALQDTGVALLDAPTLPDAVALAAQRAHAGDAVLMSPACASFDMFKDYEHRAQVFCDTVRAMADDAGQSAEGMA